MSEKSMRKITVNHPASSQIDTVQDLMDNLALMPANAAVSISPFTLYRVEDRDDVVHLEISEVEGLDYTLHRRRRNQDS